MASLSCMSKHHTSNYTPYLQLHHFCIGLNSLSVLERSNIA
jgi:hypothetical protein